MTIIVHLGHQSVGQGILRFEKATVTQRTQLYHVILKAHKCLSSDTQIDVVRDEFFPFRIIGENGDRHNLRIVSQEQLAIVAIHTSREIAIWTLRFELDMNQNEFLAPGFQPNFHYQIHRASLASLGVCEILLPQKFDLSEIDYCRLVWAKQCHEFRKKRFDQCLKYLVVIDGHRRLVQRA